MDAGFRCPRSRGTLGRRAEAELACMFEHIVLVKPVGVVAGVEPEHLVAVGIHNDHRGESDLTLILGIGYTEWLNRSRPVGVGEERIRKIEFLDHRRLLTDRVDRNRNDTGANCEELVVS